MNWKASQSPLSSITVLTKSEMIMSSLVSEDLTVVISLFWVELLIISCLLTSGIP